MAFSYCDNPSSRLGGALPARRPELLAPAGDADCIRAAVENGADAVYFGLNLGFNARVRAANITLEALPELLAFLHRRAVRGYVALNTLVFSGELEQYERTVRAVAEAGADALLVQDLGAARLVREICPELEIHASTQMTLTSAEGIRAVQSLGIARVVLARELSIREVARIVRETTVAVEVFVHGALCVAYGGQCLTSESLGGRSANRGHCAQACRLPYELVCDGRTVDLGKRKYLLSPQDLAAYVLVPELLAAGVAALKIEGRLKTADYVANITRHYRQAIDMALAGRPVEFTPRQIEEMELSFSRGFSPGWLLGNDPKRLVPGLSSAKRGVLLGRVTAVRRGRVEVELQRAVKRGDGVVFQGDREAAEEMGGRVFEVFCQGRSAVEPIDHGRVELAFARQSFPWGRLRPGQQVWKTDDPQLTHRLRKTYQGGRAARRVPVDVIVQAAVGQPLAILARTESGASCRLESDEPLAAAVRRPVTRQQLAEQLGRLGGTSYVLRTLTAEITGEPMAPLSVLGKLRRQLVAGLDAAGSETPKRRIPPEPVLPRLRAALTRRRSQSLLPLTPSPSPASKEGRIETVSNANRGVGEPVIHVLCRSLEQVRAALDHDVRSLMVDFHDIRQYAEAVRMAHQRGARILLATPRIQKPGEMGIVGALLRHGADGLLARNLAAARFATDQGVPWVADFSLNAANELTVQYLRELGAERVTAAYDLNREQLLDLVAAVPPGWLEVVIHQHMPMFHMEHCVFCAVLSPGKNKADCGRPCERHDVRLRDRVGMEHPLKADVGCRNTLFNARPQSGAEAVPFLLSRGVRHFRVELLEETAQRRAGETIGLYRRLLAGRLTGKEVWTRLKASNRVGVTRGTMEERRNPLAIL